MIFSGDIRTAQWVSTTKNVGLAVSVIVIVALSVKIGLRTGLAEEEEDTSREGLSRPMKPGPAGGATANVCLTEHCVDAAARLLKAMNLEADPCQDFHEFACGKFLKETVLPEDKAVWSPFTTISELIYERGRALLEEKVEESEWLIFRKTKLYYKSCLDEETLENLGTQPLGATLKKLGGWPVVEGVDWLGDDRPWFADVPELGRQGFETDSIVGLKVSVDHRNSSWRTIFLDQPILGMPREFLIKGFNDKDVQHYFTFMKGAAVLMGADVGTANQELKESLLFEIDLAKASSPREDRRNVTKLYNPYIVGDYPSLQGHPPSWTDYIAQVLATDLGPYEKIIVSDPSYVRSLAAILSTASPRVVSNYLFWRATKSALQYLNQAARDIAQKYERAVFGLNAPPPRWKTCTEVVGFNSYADSNFRIPAASMYVRKHFSSGAKESMLVMIGYLRNAFLQILHDLDWMDGNTKESAKTKLTKMNQFIAYPDEILDRDIVERHHEGIVIGEHDYFGNSMGLHQWNRRFKFGRLREKVDKTSWIDHSLTVVVNAFYSNSVNAIKFPAGILQGIFFHPSVPNYLNFGAIGAVIGHEITHGFDDRGRQFDYEGNLQNWWKENTQAQYVIKSKCLIDQYSNYNSTQVGLKLNGITNQGENIADNGGTKEAFMAYEQWLADRGGHEATLPGLGFTPRQLFWISWGQVWCFKFRDAALRNQILTGQHSPAQFRIVGPLSNSVPFSMAFKCAAGSGMNPQDKCSVW